MYGEASIQISFKGASSTTNFHIADCNKDDTIILGKPWIVKHGCTLNFADSRLQFKITNTHFSVPMRKSTSVSQITTPILTPIAKPQFTATPVTNTPTQPRKQIAQPKYK